MTARFGASRDCSAKDVTQPLRYSSNANGVVAEANQQQAPTSRVESRHTSRTMASTSGFRWMRTRNNPSYRRKGGTLEANPSPRTYEITHHTDEHRMWRGRTSLHRCPSVHLPYGTPQAWFGRHLALAPAQRSYCSAQPQQYTQAGRQNLVIAQTLTC